MRDFILDTQTIRYWKDTACSQHAAVVGNVNAVRQVGTSVETKPKLLVSVVSLGEIEFGHRVALAPNPALQAKYREFIREELPNPFELSSDASDMYGELRARLFNKYAPRTKRNRGILPEQLVDPVTAKELGIQENDLWLCAQAMAHGMVLVTNDRMMQIRDVTSNINPGLLVQNWTQPGTAKIA